MIDRLVHHSPQSEVDRRLVPGPAQSLGPTPLRDLLTLRDLLRLEIESGLDKREQLTTAFISERDSLVERAEAAESKLAAIEKMGREPSEGMQKQMKTYYTETENFRAMFAKMMEELK